MRQNIYRWGKSSAILLIFLAIITVTLSYSQAKKYQVIVPRASLYLEPNEKSPVVTSVPVGEILVQASAVKFRHDWVFVYYSSKEKGKTIAGYIREQMLRKLFPEVNSILLYSSDRMVQSKEIDFAQKFELPLIWGMPQEKLFEVAGRPLNKEANGELEVYQYQREIMNKQCLIEYVFWKNELMSARFYLIENYPDNNFYISDYLKIKNYLETQFGKPAADHVNWLDATYKEKSDFWGKALGSGQLEFRSSWIAGETEIDIILTGSDNKIAFLAECTGLKYKEASN